MWFDESHNKVSTVDWLASRCGKQGGGYKWLVSVKVRCKWNEWPTGICIIGKLLYGICGLVTDKCQHRTCTHIDGKAISSLLLMHFQKALRLLTGFIPFTIKIVLLKKKVARCQDKLGPEQWRWLGKLNSPPPPRMQTASVATLTTNKFATTLYFIVETFPYNK